MNRVQFSLVTQDERLRKLRASGRKCQGGAWAYWARWLELPSRKRAINEIFEYWIEARPGVSLSVLTVWMAEYLEVGERAEPWLRVMAEKAKRRVRWRRRYRADPERYKQYVAAWRAKNPEKAKAYARRYFETHRERWNAYQRAYNRRKREEHGAR